MSARLTVLAPDGVGEVDTGADLAALLLDALASAGDGLEDGDVVLATSKAVSKAEGRVMPGSREMAVAMETQRLVARRGPTSIVRTRLGLTMAAAGVDASNVARGHVVLLPEDPDASARRLRAELQRRTGRRLGVLVTDTAGRAWRLGQTDLAVGAAGVRVLESFAGRRDDHGNELAVTEPAVADELAGAAELAQGKLGRRPFAVVRGRADVVLEAGDDGPGARALVRPEAGDMFGWGSREAVLAALAGDAEDRTPFGPAVPLGELHAALLLVTGEGPVPGVATGLSALTEAADGTVELDVPGGARTERTGLAAVCYAHGWELVGVDDRTVAHPSGTRVGPVRLRVRRYVAP